MRASKFLSLIFSVSFLLILTGPTLMLLKAQSEEHAIIESIENEKHYLVKFEELKKKYKIYIKPSQILWGFFLYIYYLGVN